MVALAGMTLELVILTRGNSNEHVAAAILQSMAELPIVPPSPDWCVRVASSHYQVPVDLVRAVLKTENGCGKVVRNKNGSVDMGCM